MKTELLEHLVRLCVREVIGQVREEEELKGAAAPPASGLGTADQPEIPKEDPKPEETPQEPETPSVTPKGAILVNPRDKSKLQPIQIPSGGDSAIERTLHKAAAAVAGPHVKVALLAQRMAREAIKNPNVSVYFYLGKYDPNSEEIFLMADKSLQVAKDSSVPPTEIGAPVGQVVPSQFDASTANAGEYAKQLSTGAQKPAYGIDENLKKAVKKMVDEILNKQ